MEANHKEDVDMHISSAMEPKETGVGREDSSNKVVEDEEQTFCEQTAADYDGKFDFGPKVWWQPVLPPGSVHLLWVRKN